MSKKVEMPLRIPANLPYNPRMPAPTGPKFKGLSPLFLQYENGSNLLYKQLNAISTDTKRPQIFHFKVIGLMVTHLLGNTILKSQKLKVSTIKEKIGSHFWATKMSY